MNAGRKTRVLIIDDSALVRKILSEAVSAAPDLEVVGSAPDPLIAIEKLKLLQPDVLTLDIEMPRMDGITFLRQIMATTPIPAVVVSSLAQAGCRAALEALEAGAVEVIAKPGGPFSVAELRTSLPQRIRAAAQARIRRVTGTPFQEPGPRLRTVANGTIGLIAIGASTGGTEAIRRVLEHLPANAPPIVIVQHIPPVFSKAFAERLDQLCAVKVKEAVDGDSVRAGTALVAPGDFHMTVTDSAKGMIVRLTKGEKVCYQRPSVDVTFESVAAACGRNALGIILTGMGNDGAAGLLKLRRTGARTIAQDEASCIVYGMPRQAVLAGAVERILPLSEIGRAVCNLTAGPEIVSASLSR
jgi:two-component system chemotaxis response regulator CheB